LVASTAGAGAPERYASGLDARAQFDARNGEIAMLRRAPEGRVHIGGGSFTMGATPIEMAAGLELCKKEPLGRVLVPVFDQHGQPVYDAAGQLQKQWLHCRPLRFEAEGVAHRVTLSSFSIDRTEVRVGDYMRCVSTGACGAPGFASGDTRFANADFPVVLVTWDDARDYCKFAGGRLPTEAEWEYAARGAGGRIFPWGNLYNPHLANHGSIALDPTDATDGFAGLAPVGSIRDGMTPLGLLDMAGNAAEWVADEVDPDPSETVPLAYGPAPQVNPRAAGGARRIVRGGSYMRGADAMRATSRTLALATRRMADVGFRCAATD
jgi:formylglycine-generating enzyme required for sulfatase activity